MVALELRFVQEKAEDGQLVYRLDPYASSCSTSICDLTVAFVALLMSLSPMMASGRRISQYLDMPSDIWLQQRSVGF
jgi:hypothetical protein